MNTHSHATVQADLLHDAINAYLIGPNVCESPREVIWNVTDKGLFVDGMTADQFVHRAGTILLESGRVYRYGNSVVYEISGDDGGKLVTLAVDGRADKDAPSDLGKLFVTAVQTKQGAVESLPATRLVKALLADEQQTKRLPVIHYYSRRPTFDRDFVLRQPGWHADSGVLVHGPTISPVQYEPNPTDRFVDRVPPRLRGLLKEFGWKSDADLASALSTLLTGMLLNQFVGETRPPVVVNGNQAQLGKTLLVETIARVLDDEEPARIPLTTDEEVEKRLCAQLRSSNSGVFFFDNVRNKIESALLEQNVLSSVITFRVLGQSTTIQRPNSYLWFVTSNSATATTDFVKRAVPIELYHEGDPSARHFTGDPRKYATKYRLEILGELAGMILRWVEQGRELGKQRHRCTFWGQLIGGILNAAGLGEPFLGNLAESAATMDQGLLELASLAEYIVDKQITDVIVPEGGSAAGKGRTPGEWVDAVRQANVLRTKVNPDQTARGCAMHVATFLSGKVDSRVQIDTKRGPATATLRRVNARSGQKNYYLEIATREESSAETPGAEEEDRARETAGAVPPAEGESSRMVSMPPPIPSAGPPTDPASGEPEWF